MAVLLRLVSGPGQEVGEDEPVALYRLTDAHLDGAAEHRARGRKGMELAVLAARVDPRRQIGEQTGVEAAPRERGRQLLRIDAGQGRLETGGQHLPRQLPGVTHPERKNALEAALCTPPLTPGPGIGHE